MGYDFASMAVAQRRPALAVGIALSSLIGVGVPSLWAWQENRSNRDLSAANARAQRNVETSRKAIVEFLGRVSDELLAAPERLPADVAFLARVLEGRLRVTDTPGQLDDGRIAVLLPDTAPAGACIPTPRH